MPSRFTAFLKRLGIVVSFAVLAMTAWHMWPAAMSMLEFGDVTSDLSLPRIWYWIPVLFGVVASAAACLYLFLRRRGSA